MISILMTVGDMAENRRGPVISALQENLANTRVRDIHVVTEGQLDWLQQAAGDAASRLHLYHVPARPNFGVMFQFGNRLIESGVGTVAIMNGDISVATERDADRMLEAFNILASLSETVVLALTRHESNEDEPSIVLYDGSGLPNYLSADAWVFQKLIKVTRDLFYAPGQMNCDMFLAHDLIGSGCRLFNPCFDIVVKHHETMKDQEFYSTMLEKQGVQEMMWKHVIDNKIDPWNYLGVPWVKIDWLRAGYRPGPASTHGKRIMLAIAAGQEAEFSGQLPRLAALISEYDLEVHVVCDGDLDYLVDTNADRLADLPRILFVAPRDGLEVVKRRFLEGMQYSFDSMAFVGDLSRLTPEILAETGGVLVGLGRADASAEITIGCTLVTSVFGSDPFIRGFINNSVALQGYDRLIDHTFVVSKLSETEITALLDLLNRKPNVLVLWNREDPGLYACWNVGIRTARHPYVSNANVDDLRDPTHVITLIRALEAHPDALVAATALNPFYDYPADGTLPEDRPGWYSDRAGYFSFFDLAQLPDDAPTRLVAHNMPHCMPVWRRSLHERCGWFDEPNFGTFADWAFWLKALENGGRGWMEHEALSFYFVNPASHNRRGSDLALRHARVEEAFLPAFLARRDNQQVDRARPIPEVQRKLNLTGHSQNFGEHRNSFNQLIHALEPLNGGSGTRCRFIPFLERYFVWGDELGEAGSAQPRPITEDWIGILHVPFDAPQWFNNTVSPEIIFAKPLWLESQPYCRGVITLSPDLEADLQNYLPGLRTLSVLHPTELNVRMFDMKEYRSRPRVVQVAIGCANCKRYISFAPLGTNA